MARSKTHNVPDLTTLLTPGNQVTLAVERALMRGHDWAHAAVPVAEQIAARLAGAITLNRIKAGQRLLEDDLSTVLHVSRAPVREALRILEKDQLVAFQARRGAVVTAPDAQQLRDIFTVRRALNLVLWRQLMSDRPADLEAVLAARMPALATAAGSRSADAYAVESFLLNLDIGELGANRLLADLLRSISLRTLRYVRMGHAARLENLPAWAQKWRMLHRAVARRELENALDFVAKRIDDMRDTAIAALGNESGAGAPAAKAKTKAPSSTAVAKAKAKPSARRPETSSRRAASRA
jgi:DNA-binding GntR family transcriptional regulator